MEPKNLEIAKRVTKARTTLVLSQPFFGSLALGQMMIEESHLPTMATNGKVIKYNPDFVAKLTQPELVGVMAHEVMHTAALHHTRRGVRQPRLWNIAADYAINGLLIRAGFTLPQGALIDARFDGKGAEEIYSTLQDEGGGGGGEGDDPGGCGGVDDAPGENGNKPTQESMAAAEREANVNTMQAAAVAKGAGKSSADIDRMIGDIVNPKVNWRTILRNFMTASAKNDYSWRRPNNRYMATGMYLPALWSEEMGEVVIGVDTSGSIGQEMLDAFASEMNEIVAVSRPKRVHVIYCDAEVAGVDEFDQGEPITVNAKGGGGTRFSPVFDYVREHGINPVCLVYLTDLCCTDFGEAPEYPVLWGVKGIMDGYDKAPFGDVLVIDD